MKADLTDDDNQTAALSGRRFSFQHAGKSGKVKGIRFETLAKICEALDCQPGDLIEAVPTEVAG
ncbi:helix-turn-helix domain-containing protein [Litoreibacter halocynthiae]|uniref:helix-turn-helix domain-containing protein n=1 Tax=Litoreibacter halocynthiae TaxID=1242689 RepID=UPI003CCC807B